MLSHFANKLSVALGEPTKKETDAIKLRFDTTYPYLKQWLALKAEGYVEVAPGILRKPEARSA